MMDTELLKMVIRREEGWRALVYDDATGEPIKPGSTVVGHPTIGTGFAVDVHPMPKEVGELWLSLIVSDISYELSHRLPFWPALDPIRQLALSEMSYQMGIGGLLKFARALGALAAHDYARAGMEFRDSAWWRTQSPARAERVVKMIETGAML